MVVPKSLRLQIAIVGRVNAGKSSLLNLLTGQEVSITSDIPGTTTDTVEKNQELHELGPVTWIDSAGLGDASELGLKRAQKTKKALQKADIAIVVCDGAAVPAEVVAEVTCPIIYVFNKADKHSVDDKGFWVNALDHSSRDAVLKRVQAEIKKHLGADGKKSLLNGLVPANGTVVLIMPQDAEAPKGRLIVPQVQCIRNALDLGLKVVCVQPEQYADALKNLKAKPDLVIADSQVLKFMLENTPKEILCTTFSVLFARLKGDLRVMIEGARQIRNLKNGDKVLIAEACTHHAIQDDIARVKIPNLFRKKGIDADFEWVTGSDFPEDVSKYKLIVHCGACMFNEMQMMNRIKQVKNQKGYITNYGLCMAELQGVMDRIVEVF